MKETHLKTTEIVELNDYAFVGHMLQATFSSLVDLTETPTGLPLDMRLDDKAQQLTAAERKTSPTNIGLTAVAMARSTEVGMLDCDFVSARLSKMLTSLEQMTRCHGLFHAWYDTARGTVMNSNHSHLLSSVDNAWLALSLQTVGQVLPGLHSRTSKLVDAMELSALYDRSEDLFYGGANPLSADEHALLQPLPWHYAELGTEAHAMSWIAPHLFGFGERNFPTLRKLDGQDEAHKSHGGSMFESLLFPVFDKVEPDSEMGVRLHGYAKQAISLGRTANNAGLWGFSPCLDPDLQYREHGHIELAKTPRWGYGRTEVITPHAVALVLAEAPEPSLDQLRRLVQLPGMFGPHGFQDSFDVQSETVAPAQLSLDQAMLALGLMRAAKQLNPPTTPASIYDSELPRAA